MKTSEIFALAEATTQLRQLRKRFNRDKDGDGNPLSEKLITWNHGVCDSIDEIIETLMRLVDQQD